MEKTDLNKAVGIHKNNLECKGLTYLTYLVTSTYCTWLTPRSRALLEKLVKKLRKLNGIPKYVILSPVSENSSYSELSTQSLSVSLRSTWILILPSTPESC
jgi:hypothetical protein